MVFTKRGGFQYISVLLSIIAPTKDKLLKKARKCHKKGELFYNLGEHELAEDYYDEAEDLRKKAFNFKDGVE